MKREKGSRKRKKMISVTINKIKKLNQSQICKLKNRELREAIRNNVGGYPKLNTLPKKELIKIVNLLKKTKKQLIMVATPLGIVNRHKQKKVDLIKNIISKRNMILDVIKEQHKTLKKIDEIVRTHEEDKKKTLESYDKIIKEIEKIKIYNNFTKILKSIEEKLKVYEEDKKNTNDLYDKIKNDVKNIKIYSRFTTLTKKHKDDNIFFKARLFAKKTKTDIKNSTVKIYKIKGHYYSEISKVIMLNGSLMPIAKYINKLFEFNEFINNVKYDDFPMKMLLDNSYSGSSDLKQLLNNLASLEPFVLLTDAFINNKQHTSYASFKDIEAFRDTSNKYINYQYIKYGLSNVDKIDKIIKSVYTEPYVLKNYIKNACWFSTLIDIFYNIFKKIYKVSLTYEYLHNIIKPDKIFNKNELGCYLSEVQKFYKKYKIAFYVFDINKRCQYWYDPRDEGIKLNRHIFPRVTYFLLHNQHIYRLNDKLDRLKEIVNRLKGDKKNDDINRNYYINNNRKNNTIFNTLLNDSDQLVELYKKKNTTNINCTYNNDLQTLLVDIINKMNYEPSVIVKNSSITGISLNNIDDKCIIIRNVHSEYTGNATFKDDNELNNFIVEDNETYTNIINHNYKSYYNDNVNNMFCEYVRGGIIGSFPDYHTNVSKSVFELDFNKFYTSILFNMKKIPLICQFDNFKQYNNEVLEDYNIYFIQINNDHTENMNIYVNANYGLCYGINLKKELTDNMEILAYLKPYKLVNNDMCHTITHLYNNDEISMTHKKYIINKVIGLLGKKYNKVHQSHIFYDGAEAYAYMEKHGGNVHEFGYNNTNNNTNNNVISLDSVGHIFNDEEKYENVLYIWYKEDKKLLENGFYPIQLFIYDTARHMMHDLYKNIISVGGVPLYANTDCICIANDKNVINKFKKKYKHYFATGDNISPIDTLGKIKINEKEAIEYDMIKNKEHVNVCVMDEKREREIIKISDEWSIKEMSKVFKKNDRLIMTALSGGAGKTYALSKGLKGKVIFVCPTNELKFNLIKDKGVNAVTYENYFSMFGSGTKSEEGISKYVEKYDTVVFDEIYWYCPIKLQRIYNHMESNKCNNIRYYATGDEYQNKPIGDYNGLEKDYYRDIITRMFSKCVILQENKRIKDVKKRRKYNRIMYKIRNSETVDECRGLILKYFKNVHDIEKVSTNNNVSYYNNTAEKVSDYRHSKVMRHLHKKSKYYKGLQLICRKSNNCRKNKTYTNYIYTIVSICEEYFILSDGDNNIKVSLDDVKNKFRLPYCKTGHSLQGVGVDGKITIFDIYGKDVTKDWLYTAITRATEPHKISVFVGESII